MATKFSMVTTVATVAALSLLPTSAPDDGSIAYVKSLKSYFLLDKSSNATTDTVTTIATSTTGRWLRVTWASSYWSTYGNWYIDATLGNDEYDGTSATFVSGLVGPIKTFAELFRRWGDNPILPPVNLGTRRVCYVNLVGTIPDTDPFAGDPVLPDNTYIAVQGGVLSTVFTGTITSIVAKNTDTNTPLQITDTALPANNTWTSGLGVRVRLTSGASVGAISFVMKDLGTKNARIKDFYLPPNVDPAFATLWPAVSGGQATKILNASVGDAYAVEQLKSVRIGRVRMRSPLGSAGSSIIVFVDCQITTNELDISGVMNLTFFNFHGCVFSGFPQAPTRAHSSFITCCFRNGLQVMGGWHALWNCLCGPTAGNLGLVSYHPGAVVQVDYDTMFQGAGIRGPGIILTQAGIFDSAISSNVPGGHGVYVGYVSQVTGAIGGLIIHPGNTGAPRIWGSGNAGGGIAVSAGCSITYKSGTDLTKITITGSTPGTNDLVLNGNSQGRAWDETANAFTVQRTLSWANVRATIAGGGFGGNAVDVPSGARFASAA